MTVLEGLRRVARWLCAAWRRRRPGARYEAAQARARASWTRWTDADSEQEFGRFDAGPTHR